ncbi:helix-turn-helix domain-containing protein [Roseovarius sp.]|uniref:helix-turn-helix domain-containing protein n=1 Tax=Roseovarius sp. TaxID=1486281 RepID=UPI0035622F1B
MSQQAEVIDLSHRLPTDAEVRSAEEAVEAIAKVCALNGGALPLKTADQDEVFLSPALCNLITDVLSHVAKGEMVTIVSTGALLSTQQAADILNVSRPFVSKLINEKKLNHIKVGTHRRIELNELIRYKNERDVRRRTALDDLSEIAREFDDT